MFEFFGKQNKDISILTGNHVNHDQIDYIKNNWLSPIFLSPGDSNKNMIVCPDLFGLEGVTEVDTDSQRKDLCVYHPAGNSWLGGISSKNYINIWEIKMVEMKAK